MTRGPDLNIVGADDSERATAALANLAAIVENSDDAILSVDLNGRVISWNKAAERFYGYSAEEMIGQSIGLIIPADRAQEERDILGRIAKGERVDHYETKRRAKSGELIDVSLTVSPLRNTFGAIIGASKIARDIRERLRHEKMRCESEGRAKQHEQRLALINRAAQIISSDLDLDRIVQAVTDLATELSGAKFGAFFYNVADDKGERYVLYTLSGAPREAFESFGLPRNTAVFEPTFRGDGIVRSDDIRKDPRYGHSGPHYGMPKGHLPVVSYLAAPVMSRSGEVLGGLFFAHDEAGKFDENSENLVLGIAAHAAIAIDNARLMQEAQREITRRQRAEEAQDLLLAEVNHRVRNTLATIQAMALQTFRGASREEHAAYSARVRALAEAMDLLTKRDWGRAPISDVVARAIAPFEDVQRQRFDIGGPEAALSNEAFLPLALALHELATNAVKYGALSNDRGRVQIVWTLTEGASPRLLLTWRESGGPVVTPPSKVGFGTTLIERAWAGANPARLEFAPDGVVCAIEVPI